MTYLSHPTSLGGPCSCLFRLPGTGRASGSKTDSVDPPVIHVLFIETNTLLVLMAQCHVDIASFDTANSSPSGLICCVSVIM